MAAGARTGGEVAAAGGVAAAVTAGASGAAGVAAAGGWGRSGWLRCGPAASRCGRRRQPAQRSQSGGAIAHGVARMHWPNKSGARAAPDICATFCHAMFCVWWHTMGRRATTCHTRIATVARVYDQCIKRKHRPVFIVDIAVPRDVEEEAGQLEDVYLYTVDDLKEVIDENMRNRQKAAEQAEEIVDAQVLQYMAWLNSLDAVSTIRSLRDQANALQAEELATALRKLKQGEDPEKLLQQVSRAITNKLIHLPSSQLRQASEDGRQDLIEATRELFKLSNQKKPGPDNE